MPLITANFLGRFGNQAMQYLFARAYAEKHGCEFQCEPWVGQDIFDLNDAPITASLSRRSEIDLVDGETGINFYGYAQNQKCMIYTKEQAQRWFTIRPHLLEKLESLRPKDDEILAHRRTGDYIGYGYVQVSWLSYITACSKFGLDTAKLRMVSDEYPNGENHFFDGMKFLLDFYRLMKAPVLLRGNSTFSWLAALLGNGRVFSPVIEGLDGGKEQHCEFVEGNHPRFANLGFITDLHTP